MQAYLHVNGYFTVTEYPVLEALRAGGFQSATDIDVLALRLPHAGGLRPAERGQGAANADPFAPDPALGAADGEFEMLIAEVKEGRAELNRGARNRSVLQAVLRRFGCCPASVVPSAVEDLLQDKRATLPSGMRIRLVAFGSVVGPADDGLSRVSIGHVVRFLRDHLHRHWPVLRHAQVKDPAFGYLLTIMKALRGGPLTDQGVGDDPDGEHHGA